MSSPAVTSHDANMKTKIGGQFIVTAASAGSAEFWIDDAAKHHSNLAMKVTELESAYPKDLCDHNKVIECPEINNLTAGVLQCTRDCTWSTVCNVCSADTTPLG